MNSVDELRDEIRRSIFSEAWHGTSLLEALSQFTAVRASAHPVAGAHSAWEIALHVLAWTEEVTRRLAGGAPGAPARGDWPGALGAQEREWSRLHEEIVSAHSALDHALAGTTPERLEELVGVSDADAPLGTGLTYAVMLHGLAQHNAYHTGQLMLLLRAGQSHG